MQISTHKILHNFDAAAEHYDQQALVQAEVAAWLVNRAEITEQPRDILDIGSGTGFVASAAMQKWPLAHIAALDQAPAMLQQAQKKVPHLQIMTGDATLLNVERRFDIIFSSMMLHWLPEPRQALQHWQSWLKPAGHLHAALLVKGSFQEWRDLCRSENVDDGLWPMPETTFADGLTHSREQHAMQVTYPSAYDFLHQLKGIGAATARVGYTPTKPAVLRRLLARAKRPFTVSYQTLFLSLLPS